MYMPTNNNQLGCGFIACSMGAAGKPQQYLISGEANIQTPVCKQMHHLNFPPKIGSNSIFETKPTETGCTRQWTKTYRQMCIATHIVHVHSSLPASWNLFLVPCASRRKTYRHTHTHYQQYKLTTLPATSSDLKPCLDAANQCWITSLGPKVEVRCG